MSAPRAELLIVNARLWSDGGTLPKRDALAVAGGRIRAVGVRSALESRVGPRTRVIDARGATVTPGLCDAHIHLLPWARQRSEVSLHDCGTREEALMRIRDFLARHPGGTPVAGRGWNADDWQEPPDRAALDAVAPERPVVLHSRDFHALWVNSAALAEAGVTRRTADVEGGVIERDAALEPTGVLRENAVRLVRSVTDRAAAAAGEPRDLLERAARELHALGITAVHDFERGEAAFTAMERFARGGGGSARVRVLQCVGPEDLDRVRSLRMRSGDGDDFFRVGALKLFADGTLGSRTAAMLEPYDGTSERGLDLLPGAELEADVARALDSGLSVAIHAIGDRACHRALDAFERTGDRRARIALPCRIEHAQLVAPADLPRFAALGVAAAMQPLHCTSDIGLAERFWGSRRAGAYPWRALLDRGTLLAFGSDAPVEPPSAAAGIAAALTRERADGTPRGGFMPSQRVLLDDALRAYTEGPARLAGVWPHQGSLGLGALADFVVWERDLHAEAPARLREARPSCTVWHGEVVHEASDLPLPEQTGPPLRGAAGP